MPWECEGGSDAGVFLVRPNPLTPNPLPCGARELDRAATTMRLPGVIWLMIALLAVQVVAVYFWGVEPARRPPEGLDAKAAAAG